MLRRLQLSLLACSALSVAALAVQASAQEAASGETATVLPRVAIKGERVTAPKGSATDTPLATETTARELADKQITNLEDLGRVAEPGVNVNKTTGSVNIRGLEGNRVLSTIDGIPVPYFNDPTRSATGGVDTFSFSSLSAVDVMRGADSSRAGAGALGGVIAYRTLEPEDLIGEGRDWGALAKTTYDSSDRSWEGSAAIAKRIENTSILFQGSYRKGHERKTAGDVGGYSTTRTEANPSDYDQHNLLFKLRQQLEGGHTIGLTAERYRKDRDTDMKTSQSTTGNYRPGDYIGHKDNERDRVSLDYKFESESDDSLFDNAWASLYFMRTRTADGYTGYRTTSVIGPIGRVNDNEERTFGLIGAAQREAEIGGFNNRFTFGFDLATSTIEQYSSGYDNCGPKPSSGSYTGALAACNNLHTNQADTPKVDSQRIGLYVDDEIALGGSGVRLTPGVRFDWVKHDPKMTDAFASNASNPSLPDGFEDAGLSPKLRLAYDVAPQAELFAQWSMAFRAPTAGELYSSFGAPGTYLRLGNADLESETSNGVEVGANLGDEAFGGRVNLFYNRYRNFIDVRSLSAAEATAMGYSLASYPQGGITQYRNIARAEIYGVELSAHRTFDNGIRFGGGLVASLGKNLDNDKYLKSVAPVKAVASIGYDTEHWGVGLDFTAVAASRNQNDVDISTVAGQTSYFRTPGYGLTDLVAWWEPEQVKGLRINAGIYNLFDKKYYDYTTVRDNAASQARAFYSEPGRSFKISLTQRF
ncbi:TonB-dependent hemoglobin/transferrin/lactoferrin family receptor [Rhizobium straminoryzae]|uniref:TonB-dependent hemoglobin/transferrin/lactoferrin family receptor n=1 Tax=Rhizobium straminoryzae TaxID=1387186 RepID=A0A549TDJ7_9HYPH|nr:TonB-dependent hemoglobin/transferrin/lactoferrin family receptor [Rhizobium straminoryzae]TRL40086.1 TonB-dependent hemoglobin/transferrin/lactoferrin family receptor [Rhizobium straminoryzae]